MRRFLPLLLAAALSVASLMSAASPPSSSRDAAQAALRQPELLDLLRQAIGDHRLVLLGEMHGTRETPALVGELIDAYAQERRPVLLAVEISAGEQARLDRYLASAGAPADREALRAGPHWRDPLHDGRDSRAMFDLIEHARSLHAQGTTIDLLAFDIGGADRDRGMANALRAAARRDAVATLLVLTGNVHAMTHRPPWEMRDEHGQRIEPPMTAGRYLADLAPLSIDIRGLSGAHWACAQGHCRVQAEAPLPAGTMPGLQRNGADSAWDYDLLLPRFTPSPPAIDVSPDAAASAPRAVNP